MNVNEFAKEHNLKPNFDPPLYLHDWAEGSYSYGSDTEQTAMVRDFQISEDELDACEILLASYTDENYSGDAFVLYRKDGKLYEVNGSHCSCYGLSGQWAPEETNVDFLKHLLAEGNKFRLEEYSAQLEDCILWLEAGN